MHPAWFVVFLFIPGDGAVPLLMSVTRKVKLIEDSSPSNQTAVVPTGNHVVAVDYHLERGEVYYSEGSGQIYRSSLRPDGSAGRPIIIAEVKLSDGIAVDWIHNNVYWTDVNRQTLEVADLDGLYRKVLLNATHGVDKPRAVVVDPTKGLLFWSDWGDRARVESLGLDGKNNKTLVHSSTVWPNGLALDLTHSKLYVLDGFLSTISSYNYDGSDHRVIARSQDNLLQAFGLAYYSNTLYWNSWRQRALFKINLDKRETETIFHQPGILGIAERMMGLKVVHTSLQPRSSAQDPCETANCSQRCLLSRDLTPTCYCTFGYKLATDGKTCIEEGYLLVSWRRTIRRYNIEGDEEEPLIDSTKAAISISYHLQKGLIFWSDIEEHRIYRAPLDQLNNKTVIATPETCDGLAVDWVHDVLYWTDTDRNTLEAARLDGSKHTIIFDTGLDQPRDIALDPFEGLMFWTDWGSSPKIEQSTLDGSGRKVIIDDDHVWPNGITIDIQSKKIYYVDGKIGIIYSSSYDGSDKKLIFAPPLALSLHLFGITNFKDELYFTDWQSRTLYRSEKDNITIARSIATSSIIFLRPNGVKVVHSSLQPIKDNPCAKISCQNLCLGSKDHTARCFGEETPELDVRIDQPELVSTIFNDSIDISLNKNITPPVNVIISIQCIRRLGCAEDIRCTNNSAKLHRFTTQEVFHIPDLLPASYYEIVVASPILNKVFNITTKTTDPPEIPKITSVEKEGRKVTIKWDPVDTCIPGFDSYHYKLFKNEEKIDAGSSNVTQVSFNNLEPEVDYKIEVSTIDPAHFSSEMFNIHDDKAVEECKKYSLLCDGKEDCQDGSDEADNQCAAIEKVIVYKKNRSQIYFRVEVTNGTKKHLDKFVGSYTSGKRDVTEAFDKPAEPCVAWPKSYCFLISSLSPYTPYDFKISAALKGGRVGSKFTVSAITKEEASGPPENIKVIKHNATCLMYQWQHPNQSNGMIKSFIINIYETETFDEENCCQSFPIIELPVSEEEPFYETATTGLTPASRYAISITAKNMYFGRPAELLVDTPPPPMKVVRLPSVQVTSLLPLSWQPQEELGELPKYHDLIRSYILLLHPPQNDTLRESKLNEPDDVKELLQLKFGDKFVALWNKEAKEVQAFMSPIKVERLTARKTYKLSWVQVSQYKNSYSIDYIDSDPFIAIG